MAAKVVLRAGAITGLADGDPVATWIDDSGNGNNATQATATKRPIYRTGSGTPYLEFDGVDDFLSIPYAFTAGQAFTIFARVWSTETGSTYRNLFDGPGDTYPPMVWFDTAGKVEFDVGAARSAVSQRGKWVDVQVVHSAGYAGGNYYVNGEAVPGGVSYSAPAYTPSWFNRAGGSTWKGRVSDLRIYDATLSPAQVAADMFAGEAAAAVASMLDGSPRMALRVDGVAAAAVASMLDGTIPVAVPVTVAGEAFTGAAAALEGAGSFRPTGEPFALAADLLNGAIVGAPIIATGEAWAAAAFAATGIAFTPPQPSGLGMVLDSSAVLTVEAPLEPEPAVPPGTPPTVLHVIAPTVPVPTLVAGRPQ